MEICPNIRVGLRAFPLSDTCAVRPTRRPAGRSTGLYPRCTGTVLASTASWWRPRRRGPGEDRDEHELDAATPRRCRRRHRRAPRVLGHGAKPAASPAAPRSCVYVPTSDSSRAAQVSY